MFGVENLSTVLIVWSPPHIVLFGSLIASCAMLLPVLRKDNHMFEQLIGAFLFAAASTMAMLLAAPFYPLGPYKIISFWGAGVTTAVFLFTYFVARHWLPNTGGTIMVSMIAVVLYFVYDAIPASKIIIPHFPRLPGFIVAFSYITPAIILDIIKDQKISLVLQGATMGMIYGVITYGFGFGFVDSVSRYSVSEMIIAVASCIAGGGIAGIVSSRTLQKLETILG